MAHPSGITNSAFKKSARERLNEYVARAGQHTDKIIALTPDASTREYFRVPWRSATAIAAVYPEPFDPEVHPFLDVTRLFAGNHLPVPEILDVDAARGVILQEDLGNSQLRDSLAVVSAEVHEAYIERAISLIADIQAATGAAVAKNSIASRLAFDEAKLSWELDFFFQHYFTSLLGEKLSRSEETQLKAELNTVAAELAARPRVLCHRDFHVANLMVDRRGRLRIIDYQDARMGPASYDLVSLLLDRRLAPPAAAEIRERRLFFLEERGRRGLDAIDPDEFADEFRLTAVQRCLKATGTFSYQTAVAKRGGLYSQYIRPMLHIVIQAAEGLQRFTALREILTARVGDGPPNERQFTHSSSKIESS